jgi:hypothetical protein
LHRRLHRLVEHLHAWCFSIVGDAAHHQDRLVLVRLVHLDDLEAAGQRRVLLDVLLVLGPGGRADRAQGAARQRRLEQVGGIAGAGRPAGADQRVASSMNRMIGFGLACTSSMTWRSRCSNSPFMLAPACSSPMSSVRSSTSRP